MLGLADRARIVDLFEHVVRGDVSAALSEFTEQYEAGANPVVVLTDLADFTHLVTRFKYIPEAADDASLSEVERVRGKEFSENVAVSTLSRIWQMLLKGIPEAENSSRPAGATEMVLIRLTHAAHLPSPEDAARRLMDFANGENASAGASNGGGNGNGGGVRASMAASGGANARGIEMGQRAPSGGPTAMLRAVPSSAPMTDAAKNPVEKPAVQAEAQPEPLVPIRSLEDIADLCAKNREPVLRARLRNSVHLVKIEPGRLEINLEPDAPKTIVNDLNTKLREWTGITWWVTLSNERGAPTLVQVEEQAKERRMTDARADPDVAAILAQFPGAKITDVRIRATEDEAEIDDLPAPATAESAEGDILPGDDIEL
jgi:DNA polymerase-3 subunit gamma/tau